MELFLDKSTNELNGYLHFRVVRNLDTLEKEILNLYCSDVLFGFGDMDIIEPTFLKCTKKLIGLMKEFELKRRRKYLMNQKPRYGVIFDLLLPQGTVTKASREKIVEEFIRSIETMERSLPFISWFSYKKKAKYIHIFIYDRASLADGLNFYKKVYKKDHIINKKTGKLTKKDDPDAIVVHKKGESVLDKDGNPIREIFCPTKTRIFCFKDKSDDFINKMKIFFEFFINALKATFANFKIKKKFIIRRNNIHKAFNRWIKRIYIANNALIRYVENEINYLYAKNKEESVRKRLIALLNQFKDVFKVGKFQINNQWHALKATRCDIAENSCVILRNYFDELLDEIREGVN
ncbi:hypothetical protein [Bulleidia sp. zg-1006]|uniref:hypothetical protein n=1 Tax=Bulleidia sp. zg-1006 TaxID=2806552 RepID=UPI001939361D|nr:hypothetical protein [Bulleidia sp. zg-1006]QRG86086.1 hypothetical protein JOS54_04215 [Bulleidia sp. zg-1006]